MNRAADKFVTKNSCYFDRRLFSLLWPILSRLMKISFKIVTNILVRLLFSVLKFTQILNRNRLSSIDQSSAGMANLGEAS